MPAGMERPLLVEILAIICLVMQIVPTLVGEHAVIRAATLEHNPAGKKEKNVSQTQYQHAVIVVGYFNMVNRIDFAMDLELEEDFEKT